jgi:3-methylcrotonyl-CoA carboxylase alpha subunit
VDDSAASEEGDTVEVAITQMAPDLINASVARRGEETPQVYENIVAEVQAPSASKATLRTYYPLARVDTTVVQDPTNDNKLSVFQLGTKTQLTLQPPSWFEEALGLKDVAASVAAPMPCKILRNEVTEGQRVEKGAPLVV